MKGLEKLRKHLLAPEGKKIRLKDYDPAWTAHIKDEKQGARDASNCAWKIR